jgi:hypothetical protein
VKLYVFLSMCEWLANELKRPPKLWRPLVKLLWVFIIVLLSNAMQRVLIDIAAMLFNSDHF